MPRACIALLLNHLQPQTWFRLKEIIARSLLQVIHDPLPSTPNLQPPTPNPRPSTRALWITCSPKRGFPHGRLNPTREYKFSVPLSPAVLDLDPHPLEPQRLFLERGSLLGLSLAGKVVAECLGLLRWGTAASVCQAPEVDGNGRSRGACLCKPITKFGGVPVSARQIGLIVRRDHWKRCVAVTFGERSKWGKAGWGRKGASKRRKRDRKRKKIMERQGQDGSSSI